MRGAPPRAPRFLQIARASWMVLLNGDHRSTCPGVMGDPSIPERHARARAGLSPPVHDALAGSELVPVPLGEFLVKTGHEPVHVPGSEHDHVPVDLESKFLCPVKHPRPRELFFDAKHLG